MTAADVLGRVDEPPDGTGGSVDPMGAAKHPKEGGAGHEERTVRGTTTVRTPHAMQIVACLAAALMWAGCGNVAKTARPEALVAASQAENPNLDLTITVPPPARDPDAEQYDPWESF